MSQGSSQFNANIRKYGGTVTSLGQKVMASSIPVTFASDASTLPVSIISLPLPAGASTSALQTTGNTSVGSIDTKTPALGQALAAASTPVVLTAAQVTTLTPPAAITGFSTEATLSLIKAKTDNIDVALSTRAVTGLTDAQLRATPVPVSGTTTATPIADVSSTGTLTAAAQTVVLALAGQSAGAAQITGTWVGTITFEGYIDSLQTWTAINAVSASTSSPQTTTTTNGLYRLTPGGLTQFRANMSAFTSGSAVVTLKASVGVGGTFVNQILPSKITDGTSTAAVKAASTAAVATDPALVVAISPNNTVPVSATSLPLPAGAATSALQSTQDTSINSLLKPASTLAAVTTVGAVTAITNALPTGANVIGQVTANAGTNLNTSALALDATLTGGTQKAIARGGAKGTAVAADITSNPVDANTQALHVNLAGVNSTVPVTGTFFQATQPVSAASLPLPAGAATEATLAARIPANGQALMAASVPVTLASNQSALPVTLISTTITGTVTSAGAKTNNAAAPTTDNLGALVARATASAPTYTEGNQVLLSVDNTGALRTSASAAAVSDTNTTGSLTSAISVTSPTLNGASTTTIQITGTWVATVVFEASTDGTNFFSISGLPVGGNTVASSTAANGQWQFETGAFALVRARVSAYTSGTVVITVRTSTGASLVNINATTAAIQTTAPVGSENGVVVRNIPLGDQFITGQGVQTAAGQNIILAVAGTGSTDTVNGTSTASYRSVYMQVVSTGTITSGIVTFEGSNDNATFVALPMYDANSTTANSNTLISPSSAPSSRYLEGKVRYRYFRARISTAIGGGGSIQCYSRFSTEEYVPSTINVSQTTATSLNANIGTISTSVTPGNAATNLGKAEDAPAVSGDTGVAALYIRNDALTANVSASGDYISPVTDTFGATIIKDQQRHKRTYSCAFVVAPAATATDVFQIIGSATTTVEINKITISGTQTTGGMVDVYFPKRSTANTVGTFTASVMVPHLSTDAAATAVGSVYTANPTLGALVGNVHVMSMTFGTVATTSLNIREINFGERGKPITLSGAAQAMAINLNGVTIAGGSLKIVVEFTEY